MCQVEISYWAILSEVDWCPVIVILTRVNVGGVNNFAVGPLDGFTNLFIQPPIINHFFIPQQQKGRRQQGNKKGEWNSSKVNDTKG